MKTIEIRRAAVMLASTVLLAACSHDRDGGRLPVSDEAYFYPNIDLRVDPLRVSVDGKVLLETAAPLFLDESGGRLRIDARVTPAVGGFDVSYTIRNETDEPLPLPVLQLPGIRFGSDRELGLLNTYKLYAEHRRLEDELGHVGYFIPDAGNFHYTDGSGQTIHYQSDPAYGMHTHGSYAPVIVAFDATFAVGASLIYDFLDYVDPTAGAVWNKHYPRTRVYRDEDSWRYVFEFDSRSNKVPPHSQEAYQVSVRFAPVRYWLLTLYPYKHYLERQYPDFHPPPRDVRPISWVQLAYPGNTEDTNPRGWSWYYNLLDGDGRAYMPIDEVARGLARVLPEKGYRGVLLHSLSGQYYLPPDHPMHDDVPYQFASSFEASMAEEVAPALRVLRNFGLGVYLWWGIAGSMILGEDGLPLPQGRWLPSQEVPYDLVDVRHYRRARAELDSARTLGPAGIALDAYIRMESRTALEWLREMRRIAPELVFAVELSQDLYHRQAAVFLSRYAEDSDLDKNRIERAPVLANYLNPGAEIWAWIWPNPEIPDLEAEVRKLARLGYTPLVSHRPFSGAYRDETDVAARIVGQADKYPDVVGLNNEVIYRCANGKDDDGDGLKDWPYDPGCASPEDDAE